MDPSPLLPNSMLGMRTLRWRVLYPEGTWVVLWPTSLTITIVLCIDCSQPPLAHPCTPLLIWLVSANSFCFRVDEHWISVSLLPIFAAVPLTIFPPSLPQCVAREATIESSGNYNAAAIGGGEEGLSSITKTGIVSTWNVHTSILAIQICIVPM